MLPRRPPENDTQEESMENEKSPRGETDSAPADPICSLVSTIVAECEVIMGSPARVQEACSQLLTCCTSSLSPSALEGLRPLFQIVGSRSGAAVIPVVDMLEQLSAAAE